MPNPMNVSPVRSSEAYEFFRKYDSETVGRNSGGLVVPDHGASAAANLEEAGQSLAMIPKMWLAVAMGQSLMGGGNPVDRVASAEGLTKIPAAVIEYGSNAVVATAMTGVGAFGAVADTLHAAIHGAAAVFDRN